MITELVDKKNNEIILKTDFYFKKFELKKAHGYFHFDFVISDHTISGISLPYNKFGGRRYYPKRIDDFNVDLENREVRLVYSR